MSGTNLFAGTDGGGVFLSINNGTSWTVVNSGLTNTRVQSLAVSPSGQAAPISLPELGAMVSFFPPTPGTSWTAVDSGLTNNFCLCFCRLYQRGRRHESLCRELGVVFLSTEQRHKLDWSSLFYQGVNALAVSPNGAGGTNLFAGIFGNSVLLSTDNGTSWTAASTGLTYTSVYALAVSPTGQRHEPLCRDSRRRRLSFHQQRHKLESGQYWLNELLCSSSCRLRPKSLCRDRRWRLSFHQQRQQAGLRRALA